MSCLIQLHNVLEVQICWLHTNQCSCFAMQKYILVPNTCTLAHEGGERDVGERQSDEPEVSCQYLMVKIINYCNNLPRGCTRASVV